MLKKDKKRKMHIICINNQFIGKTTSMTKLFDLDFYEIKN
jgi:hypothetical protein